MGISVLTIMELVELIMSLVMLMFDSEDGSNGSDANRQTSERATMLSQPPEPTNYGHDPHKYNHFHYEKQLYNQQFERPAESPI